jgi:Neuraminidase (sialidase)
VYLDKEHPGDFIAYISKAMERELVNRLMDTLEEDRLYIVQLSKSKIHEGMRTNEMKYRQDLFYVEIIQCKNCRMHFPWCNKFRDELGGNGFCPYGKEQ